MTIPVPAPLVLSEQSCACTCCSGHWETVSIRLKCSGGCGCIAGTDLGKLPDASVVYMTKAEPVDATARLKALGFDRRDYARREQPR